MGIRELTDEWALKSYKGGYEDFVSSEEYFGELRANLIRLKRFRFKKMNGNSVEDLQRFGMAETYEGIRFSEIVSRIKDDEKFTPVKYLAEIERLCDEKGLSDDMTIGLLARGLRILPSFLREIDMGEQLKNVLDKRKIDGKIIRNPEMDVTQHTDILVSIGNKEYHIWLFQNSDIGIRNTKSRLQGERGEVPCGIHILCPMNPINASGINQRYIVRNGWRFYSESYVEEVVDLMEKLTHEKIPTYSEFLGNMDLSKEYPQAFQK